MGIRLALTSPHPLWHRESLEWLLGGRYGWCQALGSVDFRSAGPVELYDPTRGLASLDGWMSRAPVELLCPRRNWRACHRRVEAELTHKRLPGLQVTHLRLGSPLVDPETGLSA